MRTALGQTDCAVGIGREREQTVHLGHTQKQVHLEAETPHGSHQGTRMESVTLRHARFGRGDAGQEHQSVEHQRRVAAQEHRHGGASVQPELLAVRQELHLDARLVA